MKSEDGYPTSSGNHSTFHAAEGPYLGGTCEPCPFECLLIVACVHARRIEASSIPHGQRAVPSATATSQRLRYVYDLRYLEICVHTVNAIRWKTASRMAELTCTCNPLVVYEIRSAALLNMRTAVAKTRVVLRAENTHVFRGC